MGEFNETMFLDFENEEPAYDAWADIQTTDGRKLVWVQNIHNLAFVSDEAKKTGWIDDQNEFQMYSYLSKKGAVEMPEIEARNDKGVPLPDSLAVYVDSRIGGERIRQLVGYDGWMTKHDERLAVYPQRELVPAEEIRELLDRGLIETGIAEIMASMEQVIPGETGPEAPKLDLNELMRNMRDHLK